MFRQLMHANAWFLYNLLPSTKHVWSLKKVQQFSQYLASMLRVSQHLRSCCRFKTRVPSMDLHDLYTKSCCEKIASRWSGYFQYSQNPVWLNPHLTWRCIKKIWRVFYTPISSTWFASTSLVLWTFPSVVPNSKMNWDGVLMSRSGREYLR